MERGLARSRRGRAEGAERAAVERRFATLTARERDVLRLVVTGMLNKQIAGELSIGEKTVKIHRGHVTQKDGGRLRRRAGPDGPKLGSTRTKALWPLPAGWARLSPCLIPVTIGVVEDDPRSCGRSDGC